MYLSLVVKLYLLRLYYCHSIVAEVVIQNTIYCQVERVIIHHQSHYFRRQPDINHQFSCVDFIEQSHHANLA